MAIVVDLLLWLHLLAFAFGMGAGVAMSQVGPRLIRAAPDQREPWWPLAKTFSRMSGAALVLLLVTGPLLLWLKYGGLAGVNPWFHAKMALVVVALVLVGLGQRGMARLARGDEGGAKLLGVAGPLTGLTMLALALAAVFAFG